MEEKTYKPPTYHALKNAKGKYFLIDYFPHCLAMELWGFHTNEKHFFGSLLCAKHCTRYWSPSLQGTSNRMTVHNDDSHTGSS